MRSSSFMGKKPAGVSGGLGIIQAGSIAIRCGLSKDDNGKVTVWVLPLCSCSATNPCLFVPVMVKMELRTLILLPILTLLMCLMVFIGRCWLTAQTYPAG